MAKKREKRMVPKASMSLENGYNSSCEDLDISSNYSESKSPTRYGNSKDELEEMYCAMKSVINSVKLHDDAGPFLKPVQEDVAPGYFQIVKEPMDLSTMEVKVQTRVYKSKKHLEKDFRKMVNNCEIYNGVTSAYTNMAYKIWRVFSKSMKKHFAKCSKLKAKGTSPDNPEINTSQPKLYVCSSKTIDGAIKITIKQKEARTVPPTTLQSVKSSGNGKPLFEIKKEDSGNTPERKRNQNNQNFNEINKNEIPIRKATFQSNPKPSLGARSTVSRRRKKKKKPVAMKALEALAQAAERALKDAASKSSFDDDTYSSHSNSPIYNNSAFPNLKISTTQSHPADQLYRLYSKTLNGYSSSEKDLNINNENDKLLKNVREPHTVVKEEIVSESKLSNDISSIFPCAADTLVFPRSSRSCSKMFRNSNDSFYNLSEPSFESQNSRTKFFDSEEDSSSSESDFSMLDEESLNGPDNNFSKSIPQIKPCQVMLSRLSPRLYYKGNKVRILEQVKREKKRKKKSNWKSKPGYTRKLSFDSTMDGPHTTLSTLANNNNYNQDSSKRNATEVSSIFSSPPMKEYAPEEKPTKDETNFQPQWIKSNVPPRKRYSSLIPTLEERKVLFKEDKVEDGSVFKETAQNLLASAPLESSNNYEIPLDVTWKDKITKEVETVQQETLSKNTLNTFQFESITDDDSSSDEGYTTNERTTPVFNSKDNWYFNSLTSRLCGGGDSLPGQYPRKDGLTHELQFGMTPFGNSDLPNERNGFSFEAQCQRENFFHPIKPSYIDFSLLTPLNLEKLTPNLHKPYYPQNTYPGTNTNSGLVTTSGSPLCKSFPCQKEISMPYETFFQHSSQ